MKEENQKFENRQKALKFSSKDHVVQRINKTMNKPSESNVHQRGNIDLGHAFDIREGIKQVIENEKLRNKDDSDMEEKLSPTHPSTNHNENDPSTNEENVETGSLLAISDYKRYMEWYYLKKFNQAEDTLPEELNEPLNAKKIYNADTKP